jgi:hypothetical protein
MAYKQTENESEKRQNTDNILLLSVASTITILRYHSNKRGQRYDVTLTELFSFERCNCVIKLRHYTVFSVVLKKGDRYFDILGIYKTYIFLFLPPWKWTHQWQKRGNITVAAGVYILCTYLLTPWSRVLLENLTGSASSQEIPRIFGTRRFLAVPTSARHLSVSWANSIQSP